MKFKKVLALSMTILMVLGCVGCSGSSKSTASPETVVKNYLEALKKSDFEDAAKYIDGEQEGLSGTEEDAESKAMIATLMDNLSYSIVSSTENGDEAVIIANIKNIDMTQVISTYMQEVFTLAFSGVDEAEMETKSFEALTNAMDTNKTNLTENEVSIALSKTESGWIIDMDDSLGNAILGGMFTIDDDKINTVN